MLERRSAEDFEKWISRCGNTPQRFGERMGLDPEVVRDVVKRVRHRHSDTWELMKSISIHLRSQRVSLMGFIRVWDSANALLLPSYYRG